MEKRTKLEPSNTKRLSVDYSENSKAYKFYIPGERKTIVNRDVNFDEDFASRKSREPLLVIGNEEQEALKVESCSPATSTSKQHP